MFEPVIGLEIHVQLATQSKIFSGASSKFGGSPNSQACGIDLGLPGVLPVPNKTAFEMAVKFGLAINGSICTSSEFDRKNYFYPDLPKGYQISQFNHPIVQNGEILITLPDISSQKRIRVNRAHLEEDAGKSIHDCFEDFTAIDLNRAGTTLLEIVSEPDLSSAKEAVAYVKVVHSIIRYLEISDGNMAEGSLRCDCNVSVRKTGNKTLGTRTEIKNVNSFRFIEKAINGEIDRQINLIEDGGIVQQETRLYDSKSNETRPMRSKEEANDYRYFPDPDLLPIKINSVFIDHCRESMPELPSARLIRYQTQFEINQYDASVLVADKDIGDYFEIVANLSRKPKQAANWVTVNIMSELKRLGINIKEFVIAPETMATLILRISDGVLNSKTAKMVFKFLMAGSKTVDSIIEEKGLTQVSNEQDIKAFVQKVIEKNQVQISEYKQANHEKKTKMTGFFIGQIMKESRGKVNPKEANRVLTEALRRI